MTDHKTLLGKSDRELLMICAEATHQHYKGGLYRLLGPVNDSVTGEPMRYRASGEAVVIYEHVYPHKRQLWARGEKEFHGRVPQPGKAAVDREGWPLRFRPLGHPGAAP